MKGTPADRKPDFSKEKSGPEAALRTEFGQKKIPDCAGIPFSVFLILPDRFRDIP